MRRSHPEVLWTAHQNGVDSVRTSELIDEVFTRYKKTRKTVENSFPELMAKEMHGWFGRVVVVMRSLY